MHLLNSLVEKANNFADSTGSLRRHLFAETNCRSLLDSFHFLKLNFILVCSIITRQNNNRITSAD